MSGRATCDMGGGVANLLPGVFNGPVGLVKHGQATSWEIAAIYICTMVNILLFSRTKIIS